MDFLVLIITGFIVLNIYHDGKYLEMIKAWKKYYHMAFYAFIGLSLYIFMKKHPHQGRSLLTHANTFVKYIPMDKNSGDFISPLLNVSSKMYGDDPDFSPQYKRMMSSGQSPIPQNGSVGNSIKSSIKRSVSETKKKFVAANQSWKCAKCMIKLPAWFEVDHKLSLHKGGDNHVNNLEALCRDCHGEKTARDSML